MKKAWVVSLLLTGAIFAMPQLSAQREKSNTPRYEITDLGNLPGGIATYGNGINDRGEVVGAEYFSFQNGGIFATEAFLWKHGKMQPLGSIGGVVSDARSINRKGTIVGSAAIASDPYFSRHAMIQEGGTMKDLGTLGGTTSDASGINNHDQVVGSSQDENGNYVAFLTIDGQMTSLGSLGGYPSSQASAINDLGHIVGEVWDSGANSNCPGTVSQGFFYDGTMHGLGDLGGQQSSAEAINKKDLIVGSSLTPDCVMHAFLFDGTMHDLGVLEGGASYATSINSQGQVVGGWFTPGTMQVNGAFLYENGTMFDLQALVGKGKQGWNYFILASGINDQGEIVGSGVKADGVHAFMLRPLNGRPKKE